MVSFLINTKTRPFRILKWWNIHVSMQLMYLISSVVIRCSDIKTVSYGIWCDLRFIFAISFSSNRMLRIFRFLWINLCFVHFMRFSFGCIRCQWLFPNCFTIIHYLKYCWTNWAIYALHETLYRCVSGWPHFKEVVIGIFFDTWIFFPFHYQIKRN